MRSCRVKTRLLFRVVTRWMAAVTLSCQVMPRDLSKAQIARQVSGSTLAGFEFGVLSFEFARSSKPQISNFEHKISNTFPTRNPKPETRHRVSPAV
jgi:hypothetical protein